MMNTPTELVGQQVSFTAKGMAKVKGYGLPIPLPTARVASHDGRSSPTLYYVAFDGYRDAVTGRKRWGFVESDLSIGGAM